MNRSQIRTSIRQNIEDQGSFYSDSDLNAAIQECYKLYVNQVKVIEKRVVLDITADLVYYDFSNLIPDYLIVNGIFDNTTKQWLTGKSRLWLDKLRTDWETMTGSLKWFSIINHQYVAIVPHPVVTAGTIDVHYSALAPTINTDTEVIKVLAESEHVFQIYAQFYLMLQAKEFTKAKISLKEFENSIKEAIIIAQSRGLPSRTYGLGSLT